MLAVDTNVLVRLLVRDYEKQARLADQFVAKGAWVSHLVLAEAMWVLDSVYARTPGRLAAALRLMLTHESLVLQDADAVHLTTLRRSRVWASQTAWFWKLPAKVGTYHWAHLTKRWRS